MSHNFYKLIFLLLFFTFNLQANSQDTIKQEISILKEKLLKLDITYTTKNTYIDKDFENLKNDIRELETKLEKETIDKKSVQKDFENFNNLIKMQDNSIDKLNFYVAFFAILITVLVLYITFRNEGIAKNVASEEIEKWLETKADKKLGDIVELYKNDFNKHLNDATCSLDNIKETEKEVKDLYSNLKENNENISEELKKQLKEKSDNLKESIDKEFTLIELEELFLSAYYEKEYKEAIKYSKLIISHTPSFSAYNNLGRAYSGLGENNKAMNSYIKGLELSPNNYIAYYNMGISYGKLGEHEKAITLYEKAIEINPKYDPAYYNMGNMYSNLEKYALAIESYKKAIEINPKKDEAYNNMGNAYGKLEKYEEAISSYEKAIEINPKDDGAYANLFEIELIGNKPFRKELESKYIKFFKEEKEIFIQYELLKILSQINDGIKVDTDKWLENYKEQNLTGWSFDELINWANTKNSPIKENLLEAIEVFKTKKED